jgi:hypothetical protein
MTNQQYTQVDILLDMIHAVDFYDDVGTFEDAKAFAIEFFLKNRGTSNVRPTHGCADFDQYFYFLQDVSKLSGTWKNIHLMAQTKAGTKKILKKFLQIARKMENWEL